LVSSIYAKGQSFTGSVSGTATIYSVLNISITNLSGVVSFNTPSDYFSGIIVNNSATLAIKSNVSWQVGISSQSAYFQAMTQGASTTMPASILGIRRNGTTNFLQMSTSSQTLKTGNKGNTSTSGNTFDIDTEIDPGFGYSGGSYNIGIVFTLTQQ
jgi:hypothetical protein